MKRFMRLAVGRLSAVLLLSLFAPWISYADTSFNFTLTRAGKTSAGVYDSSGKLVSTLWSDAYFNAAGAYSALWDNKDDYGATVPAGTYTIKVLAHNTNYVWEGVVGNTSDNTSGLSVHSCYKFTTAMAFTGTGAGDTKGFYSVGYSENSAPFYTFAGATPNQVAQRLQGCTGGGNDYDWDYASSDGAVVYFACPATQNQTTPLIGQTTNAGAVCAFNADGTIMSFTTGTVIKEQYHPFVNGIFVGTQPGITGLAVQKGASTLLAVSVAADNKVYLVHKTTGAAVGSFTVAGAGALAFDSSDNLWVVTGTSVQKYTNINTAPNSPTLSTTITGFTLPQALAVSSATAPQPNLLLVQDGGVAQQLKAYDSTGVAQWTFGAAGGYATSPSVTTGKFWFRDIRGSIAFQPDGSFWVVDYMNCRNLNYTLSSTAGAPPTYQKQIAYIPGFYTVSVDQNNPNRVFAATGGKWFEFAVNYGIALGGTNGSWTLVKNWGYGVPADHKSFTLEGLRGVATLSNGRTYGLARKATSNQSTFELPSTGNIRLTAAPNTTSVLIYSDGTLRTATVASNVVTFKKQTLTGFDVNNDPQWAAATTLATAPAVANVNPSSGADSGGPRVSITSGNKLVFFDNSPRLGMHLGGVNLSGSTTSWMWETAPAIDQGLYLWGDGSYETTAGINYYGGLHDSRGANIVYQYKGENWQGGEASQMMHFYEDGLFVGQFGTSGKSFSKDSVAGFAGNTLTCAMTVSGSNTYLYVNDESQHGGIHRWRLDGTSTLAELSGSGALDSTVTLTGTAPAGSAPSRPGVPAAPLHANATPGVGHVFLQWDASANSTYYQVRRATAFSAGYQIIATSVFANVYDDTDVTDGVTYYYRVVAVNEKGAGNLSAATPATPSSLSDIYEAEAGTLSGLTARKDLWASGGWQLGNNGGGSVTINNINGGPGGTVQLIIRYAFNLAGNWSGATLKINGSAVTLPAMPPTAGWQGGIVNPYSEVTLNVTLLAGATNTLVMTKPPCLDKFTFRVSSSFLGAPWQIPAGSGTVKIEAEHYNYGGQGVAFNDTGVVDANTNYRANDAVANASVPAASNGYNIGYISPAEWLEYTVNVPTTKAYALTVYAGTNQTGKTLRVQDETGADLTGTMTIANTGSYSVYGANTATVSLTAGTHRLRIYNITGGYNLDYLTLSH